jgi:hypothetical protein
MILFVGQKLLCVKGIKAKTLVFVNYYAFEGAVK